MSLFHKLREKIDEKTPDHIGVEIRQDGGDEKLVIRNTRKGKDLLVANLEEFADETDWTWDDKLVDNIGQITAAFKLAVPLVGGLFKSKAKSKDEAEAQPSVDAVNSSEEAPEQAD